MSFSVEIQVGLDQSTASVTASGSGPVLSTDAEAAAFALTDANMAEMFTIEKGKAPNGAYRRDPCLHGTDIYSQSGITPVETAFGVDSASITGLTTTTIVAASTTLDNSGGAEPASFTPTLTASETNTIDSVMDHRDDALTEPVDYAVSFTGTGGDDDDVDRFEQDWADSFALESPNTFTVTADPPIVVPAGQVQTADLLLDMGTMTVVIDYALSPTGIIIGCYEPKYQGHFFYEVPPDYGLGLLNLPATISATQTLTITFYANPRLRAGDGDGASVES